MAKFSQQNRPMRVDTTLGEDVLLLEGFAGDETVSSPYGYTLDLLSENPAIAAADVLRTPMAVTIKTLDGQGERFVHGLVRSFAQLGQSEGLTEYRAEIVPWLWFLSLSSDCRIFQNLTVPDIVTQIFKDWGYSDWQLKLVKPHPKRLFCVQYRESHLNFIARLLEEEGIFYFFEHTGSKHMLTLADDNGAVKPCPGQSKARMASEAGQWQKEDVVTAWETQDAVHTGKVTLRDYDYEQPSLQLESAVVGAQPEEHYAYPGRYTALDDGDRLARLQLEAEEARQRQVRGAGTCRTFQTGYRFDLKDHYRKDANQAYLLLEVRHSARAGDYRSWESAPFDYRNDFLAIPHSVPFRPLRTAPKPRIWGTQTALVVGKAGEEIWTDKHGRVKVQFYWDRLGKKDENSSCWIRVSQPWAGKGWGSLSVPRIGQEVIVEFLEGDPDQPIITGRVYNAEQTPPYDPGKGGVVSGLRSNTHKGKGYNEMSMDDTAGKEKITIHSQYDMSTTVQHDQTNTVNNDFTETIKKNATITVTEGNLTHAVKTGTASYHVKGAVTQKFENIWDSKVTDKVSIKANKDIYIDSDTKITLVTGGSQLVMESNGAISLTGSKITIIGKDEVGVSSAKTSVAGSTEAKFGTGNQTVATDASKVAISGAAISSGATGQHEITGAVVKIN